MNETSDTKQCHFCKESIHKDAKICKHCGKKQPNKTTAAIYSIIILIFIIILIVNAFHSSSTPIDTGDNSPAVTVPVAAVPDTVLLALSGSGTKSTKIFTTSSDEWSMEWAYNCSGFGGGQGNFIVSVMNPDGSMAGLIGLNELGAKGTDIENYHQGGSYYLEVNSECDWKLQVKG